VLLLGLRIVYGVCKVMLQRIDYPFELEWMEGGMLLHVWQVLQGKALYDQPSPEFMPFLYTPGYTYVSALFAEVFGVRLFALRLVSLLATLANVAMLARLVHIETRNVPACFAACALFGGSFQLSGGWFDLARVDSLAIAFTLGAILSARVARTSLGFGAAGLLAAAAFMTKQTQLVALPSVLLWSAVRGRAPAPCPARGQEVVCAPDGLYRCVRVRTRPARGPEIARCEMASVVRARPILGGDFGQRLVRVHAGARAHVQAARPRAHPAEYAAAQDRNHHPTRARIRAQAHGALVAASA
jgi:hypothetical protein